MAMLINVLGTSLKTKPPKSEVTHKEAGPTVSGQLAITSAVQ